MVFAVRILTLFPAMWPGPLAYSLIGKALLRGIWTSEIIDIRSFAGDKHRSVDDTPAGGGPGMVLRADVLAAALDQTALYSSERSRWPVVCLSPRGIPITQQRVQSFAKGQGITLICGRFEGIDQRVLDVRGIDEICVGDSILTGGDIPAMAVVDAIVRLLPGVLGDSASVLSESFSEGLLEYPQFTKPQEWEGNRIPEVLLSGDHIKIAKWRQDQAIRATRSRRPDLWEAYIKKQNHKPSDLTREDKLIKTEKIP